MIKMLFTFPQEKVKIVKLPNGMYDVTVLDNEELVDAPSAEDGTTSAKMYQYDGNQFRTVYEVETSDIISDMEKWLNYNTIDEPTMEQLAHDNDLIDQYTLELMEAGLI